MAELRFLKFCSREKGYAANLILAGLEPRDVQAGAVDRLVHMQREISRDYMTPPLYCTCRPRPPLLISTNHGFQL